MNVIQGLLIVTFPNALSKLIKKINKCNNLLLGEVGDYLENM